MCYNECPLVGCFNYSAFVILWIRQTKLCTRVVECLEWYVDNVPGELEVSKAVECDPLFLQCFDTDGWVTEGIRPVKSWVLVCWWRFDWSFAFHTAPVVTTTSIILTSNKIQNGVILVSAYWYCPGSRPLNKCSCLSCTDRNCTICGHLGM